MDTEIKLQKINNVVVKPVQFGGSQDNRPIRGADLFPELYANILLLAKKKSGKTQVINKIVRSCAGRDTRVVIFSSTINKDKTYQAIRKWCKTNGVSFTGFPDIMEGKVNILDKLISKLAEEGDEKDLEESDDDNLSGSRSGESEDYEDDEDISEEEHEDDLFKPRMREQIDKDKISFKFPKKDSIRPQSKYQEPEWLLILDDMSHALKNPSIASICKKNRHFRMKLVISTQWSNDCKPETLKQMDYVLAFKGLSDTKLEKLITDHDLNIEYETLEKVYHNATAEPYNFLYIDCRQDIYRKNFDKQYIIRTHNK